jgi:hypothetical protein
MNDTSVMGAHGPIFDALISKRAKPAEFLMHGGQYIPSEDELPHDELSEYFTAVAHLRGLSTMQRALADDAAEYCRSSPLDVTVERRDLKQRFLWEASTELPDHIE